MSCGLMANLPRIHAVWRGENLASPWHRGTVVCICRHTDVVPTGPETDWVYPPFGGDVIDGMLHGAARQI